MMFGEFELMGFSKSQKEQIQRRYKYDTAVGMNITQEIADMTGYSVGLLIEPKQPPKIVRLEREI